MFLLAAQLQSAPAAVLVMPAVSLQNLPDPELAVLTGASVASSLERNGFTALSGNSSTLTDALAEARSAGAPLVVSVYYSSEHGTTLYGVILDARAGVAIDAFNLQDERAALRGLAEIPAAELPGPGDLADRFAARIVSRIRTNPNHKVRGENLQEYIDGSPLRELAIPRGKARGESDVFLVLEEQRIRTGTRTDQKLKDVPATVRVITAEDIRRKRYRFLEDLLRDQPGFDMIWFQGVYGPIFMQRGIDGPENFRTILLIDGVPDNTISSGSANIKHKYSLHNVKRVEILYGPASSLYGANAFSGVINVITMDGEDVKGLVEASVGSYYYEPVWKRPAPNATLTVGGVLGEGENALSLIGSGHWIDTEGPSLTRRDNTDPRRSSYYWSEGFTGSRLNNNYMASFKGRYKSLTIGAWQERDFTGQGTYATGAAYTEDGRIAYWNTLASAAYIKVDQEIGSRVREQFQAVYRDTSVVDGADADRGTSGAFAGPITVTRYRRPDSEISFDNPLSILWSSRLRTTVGVSYARAHPWTYNTRSVVYNSTPALYLTSMPVSPDLDSRNKFYLTNAAAYAEQYWQILGILSATLGYRYDVSSLRGKDGPEFCGTDEVSLPGGAPNPHFLSPETAQSRGCVINDRRQYYSHYPARRQYKSSNPRVGFVLTPASRLTFKISVGEAFRVPTVREVFSQSSSRTTNSSLRPEKIRTAEGGVSYYPVESLRLEGVLFASYVRHLISLAASEIHTPGKSQTTYMSAFQNAGSAQVYGTQLSADGRLLDWLVVSWNYTYQQSWIFDARDSNMLAHRSAADELLSPSDNALCRTALINAGASSLSSLCPRAHGRMPRVASHKMNTGVTIEPWAALQFDVRFNYVGARQNIATSPLASVPAYLNMNLSVGTRNYPFAGTDLTIRVHNALNENILDPGTRDARGDYFPAVHPQPERYFGWEIAHRL